MLPFNSEIDLSREGIVEIAHCVIQTIQCEWEGCPITLNSWNTLAKHLLRHCSHVVQQNGVYQCSYSRCSGRLHSSLGALTTHVELSHLSRVALPCPARGCKEAFIRVQKFHSHFEHTHRELIDKRVSVDVLAPLAVLAPPRRLRSPPPLNHKTRTGSLLAPVSMPVFRLGYSQASVSQDISRRWTRLNAQDDESDEDPIPFDDLSPPLNTSPPDVVHIGVQRQLPVTTQSLLSRPQPPIYPPGQLTSPKQGILYPAFVRMVDKLVAAGTLAGRKEGDM